MRERRGGCGPLPPEVGHLQPSNLQAGRQGGPQTCATRVACVLLLLFMGSLCIFAAWRHSRPWELTVSPPVPQIATTNTGFGVLWFAAEALREYVPRGSRQPVAAGGLGRQGWLVWLLW